jgi:hypothetical protein
MGIQQSISIVGSGITVLLSPSSAHPEEGVEPGADLGDRQEMVAEAPMGRCSTVSFVSSPMAIVATSTSSFRSSWLGHVHPPAIAYHYRAW